MGVVLGLSLTSDDVVWVLVDEADGTVIDHDVIEIHSDTETAGAAARGAHAIATNSGFDVECVRLTWSDDVTRDGLRLRTRLGCCGFGKVEAVPFGRAGAVTVHPGTEPGLALAYGAAVAEVDLAEAITVPVVRKVKARRGIPGKRIGAAVVSAAAAAALAGVLLTSGSAASVEQTAPAAAAASLADPGWVAVPAPSDSAANTIRKVVESEDAPDEIAEPEPVAVWQPPVDPEPVAVPVTPPAAEPAAELTGVPHLPVPPPVPAAPLLAPPAEMPAAAPVAPLVAPLVVAPPAPPTEVPAAAVAAPVPEAIATGEPHLPAAQPAPPAPEMTVPANLFTALP